MDSICLQFFTSSLRLRKSYYNLSLHGVCLSLNFLAVYGSTVTKLGREVGDGRGIRLRTLVSMVTKQVAMWVRNVTFLTFQSAKRSFHAIGHASISGNSRLNHPNWTIINDFRACWVFSGPSFTITEVASLLGDNCCLSN